MIGGYLYPWNDKILGSRKIGDICVYIYIFFRIISAANTRPCSLLLLSLFCYSLSLFAFDIRCRRIDFRSYCLISQLELVMESWLIDFFFIAIASKKLTFAIGIRYTGRNWSSLEWRQGNEVVLSTRHGYLVPIIRIVLGNEERKRIKMTRVLYEIFRYTVI